MQVRAGTGPEPASLRGALGPGSKAARMEPDVIGEPDELTLDYFADAATAREWLKGLQ